MAARRRPTARASTSDARWGYEPAAGVATASGGVAGELDEKGDPGREEKSEE